MRHRRREQTSKVGTLVKQSVSYYINNEGLEPVPPSVYPAGWVQLSTVTWMYISLKNFRGETEGRVRQAENETDAFKLCLPSFV